MFLLLKLMDQTRLFSLFNSVFFLYECLTSQNKTKKCPTMNLTQISTWFLDSNALDWIKNFSFYSHQVFWKNKQTKQKKKKEKEQSGMQTGCSILFARNSIWILSMKWSRKKSYVELLNLLMFIESMEARCESHDISNRLVLC